MADCTHAGCVYWEDCQAEAAERDRAAWWMNRGLGQDGWPLRGWGGDPLAQVAGWEPDD